MPTKGMQHLSISPAPTQIFCEVMGMSSFDTASTAENARAKKNAASKLSGLDLALLWFGAAVVVDELWSGAQVAPVGIALGIVLIVAGRLTGNLLLGLVAKMGAETGRPTMVLSRASFGIRGSIIPALCNIAQLIGWTAYMLVVASEAIALVFGRELTTGEDILVKLIIGAITTAWAVGGSRYWKIAHRIAVALLLALSIVMTYSIFREHSFASLMAVPRPEGHPPMLIFDVIVAMAISWVPLAADYGRFATSARAAAHGTYWGYFAGSTWMYIVGLLGGFAFLAANPGTPVYELAPGAVVLGSLSAMKLAVAGLILVVVSTITTTFLDIYSTAASALNIVPNANEKMLTIVGGALGTLLAFFINMHSYVPFLLLIGVVFLPMFAVIATDYLFIKRGRIASDELFNPRGIYWYSGGFNIAAIVSWVVGMAISIWAEAPLWLSEIFGVETWAPFFLGKTIPSFFITAALYYILSQLFGKRTERVSEKA